MVKITMSRLAKKPIIVPVGTEVKFSEGILSVKGPLGEIKKNVPEGVVFEITEKEVLVNLNKKIENKALLGTFVSHLKNMIAGTNKSFEKKLVIEGVGYKADIKNKELILNVGFSHQVKIKIPDSLKVETDNKNNIMVSGIDKEEVGNFTASVRAVKKPEPYKGKGIRYFDEVIKRKQGKKTA